MENFYTPFLISRGDRIRTYDPLVPNQVFYRTELHPETSFSSGCKGKHFICSTERNLQILYFFNLYNTLGCPC